MPATGKAAPANEDLSVSETTRRLGGYEGHTYALLRAGKLTGRKVDGRWRIDAGSVAAHLRKRRSGTAPAASAA